MGEKRKSEKLRKRFVFRERMAWERGKEVGVKERERIE